MENINSINGNENVQANQNNTGFNNQMYYQPQAHTPVRSPYIPKIEIPKFKINKKDIVFSVLFFVLSFIIVDFSLFHGFNLGATISFVSLFVVTTLFLFNKKAKPSVFSLICGVLSLAGAVTFTIFNDIFIKAIMLFLVSALFTIYTCGISGTFRNKQGSFKMLCDLICSVFAAPFKNFGITKNSYSGSVSKNKGFKSSVIGILISLPVLLVVIPLLTRSDAAFSGLVSKVLTDIGMYFVEFLLAVIVTFYVLLYMMSKRKNLETGSENASRIFNSKGCIPNSAAVSFLSVISVTYLVYLFSQLAYFFSAFSGFLPEDYEFTESAYARRGFFEMFAICVINIIIISVVNILIKRHKGAKSLATVKFLSVFIMLFTILLLVTAMAKMKLCLGIFGLSKNRILVCAFMVMIFVIILFYIIHIFAPKISYMQPIIIICSTLFIALSYSNVDAMIVKYNVDAFNNDKIESLDMEYIGSLSDDAVPYMIELTKSDDEKIAKSADNYIVEKIAEKYGDSYYNAYYNNNDFSDIEYDEINDFRSYNRAELNADKQIAEYYNSLSADERVALYINYRIYNELINYGAYSNENGIYEVYAGDYTYYYKYNEQNDDYEFLRQEKFDEISEEIL